MRPAASAVTMCGDAVASQGGNPAGCPSPKGEPRAVHVNVTSVPLGNGWITAYPYGSTAPTASHGQLSLGCPKRGQFRNHQNMLQLWKRHQHSIRGRHLPRDHRCAGILYTNPDQVRPEPNRLTFHKLGASL